MNIDFVIIYTLQGFIIFICYVPKNEILFCLKIVFPTLRRNEPKYSPDLGINRGRYFDHVVSRETRVYEFFHPKNANFTGKFNSRRALTFLPPMGEGAGLVLLNFRGTFT